MPSTLKWTVLIRSLGRGGAERQALILARALQAKGHLARIITFYDGGAMPHLVSNDVEVPIQSLRKQGRWDVVGFLIRLVRTLRTEPPDVLYAYLTVANVIATLVRPFAPATLLVWGVRASNTKLTHYDWFARLIDWIERMCADRADLIIANSKAGRAYALSRGFPVQKMIHIPNGIDTELFAFNSEGRLRVRRDWGIADGEILIGLAARFDVMKDHESFIRAAAVVQSRVTHARFVCVGDGRHEIFEQAKILAAESGLASKILWPGARDDMPDIYSALDVACSSSRFGEGFSNAISEAMSCGTPCVATDVGDASDIIGDTGLVCPPGDAASLARCLIKLATLSNAERAALGAAARRRIEENYGIEPLADKTIDAVVSRAGGFPFAP